MTKEEKKKKKRRLKLLKNYKANETEQERKVGSFVFFQKLQEREYNSIT